MSASKKSSDTKKPSSIQGELPKEIIQMIKEGTAVIASMNVLKATYDTHYARNTIFPCDVVVTDIGFALHEDTVVIKLESPENWQLRPGAVAVAGTPEVRKNAAKKLDDDEKNQHQVDDQDNIVKSEHTRLEDGRDIVYGVKGRANHIKKLPLPEELQTRYCNNGESSSDKFDLLGTSLRQSWTSNLQPRGSVEYIIERKKPLDRLQSCLFYLSPNQTKPPLPIKKDRWYRFKSYNVAYPFIAVYGEDIPSSYQNENITNFLFMVELYDLGTGYAKDMDSYVWADNKYPVGKVLRSIGSAGTVEAESIAITATNQIRDFPFSEEVVACVADSCPIPSKEQLKKMNRKDLRETEFVTTIDPATARDLDDALSIAALPNGGYRVGVHIADVSHFVEKDTALDTEASQRCTSTYLVERVVPMLPKKLCEDYCSLNAGTDKFAFSGIWHFDKEGKVQSEWFGQSVIRNRCRMAYEDAQRIIEGDESGDTLNFINEDAPRHELVKKVIESVKMLYKLSLKLKKQRQEKGAISLGKKKLSFVFENMNSRLAPVGFKFETQREANRLVEEFMLWANFRVAEKVVEFLPRVTLLRQHSPPIKKKLDRFVEQAHRHGYSNFSSGGSTGKALREALDSYKNDSNYAVLSFMVVICMSLAKYVCSSQGMQNQEYESDGSNDRAAQAAADYMSKNAGKRGHQFEKNLDEDQKPKDNKKPAKKGTPQEGGEKDDVVPLAHYALAAAYYCHFTSPIRRYADLITHRQLLLALDIEREIKENNKDPRDINIDDLEHGHYFYEEDEILEIAVRCNKMKELAKKSGGMSCQLFLSIFLDALRERETRRRIGDAVDQGGSLEDLKNPNKTNDNNNDDDDHNKNNNRRQIGLPTEIQNKAVKFYATGIIVRTMPQTFTVQLRELALEVEIYHNAKAQRWEDENEVDEDSGDFKIQWSGMQSKEECSIFTELVGEVVTIQNPITQVYFVVLPPGKRKNVPLITEKLRLD